MNKDELSRLKKVADSRMACHRKTRRWFRTQHHIVGSCCRQILDGKDINPYWQKLDSTMQNMTGLGPHYISDMKADLELFHMFPRFCATLKRHLSMIEPTYQAMVDKWLEIRRSLGQQGTPSEGTGD